MSDRLPPIPTPTGQIWRQIRLQYFPVVAFVLGLGGAATLWTQWVAPPTLVGEAEATRAELRSAQAGTLARLDIDLLQTVAAGQVLGYLHVSRPEILDASLGMIRAEIELIRSTLDPVIGHQRAALDFDRLHLDWMAKRVELASLQGSLHQNESTLARSTRLHASKMITDEEFDLARNARDTLAAQVQAQSELINRLEPSIKNSEVANTGSSAQGLQAAIQQKLEELRFMEAQYGPVPLVAPIDGVVTLIHRKTGEAVGVAEPILQISATQSKRIIGFLRLPVSTEAKPGMTVEVRTRRTQREAGTAQITHVGQQLEPISPTLLALMRLPITTVPTEFGLRVLVTPPSGLTLLPGEPVDLILRN